MATRTLAAKAFQTRFGCSLPLVCPPMAGVAGGRLAAAVHNAGGFGYIGAGHKPIETLVEDVRLAREALSLKEGDDLPLGIGFMGWKFEEPHLPADQGAKEGDKWLRYIIHEANARSIWISFAVDLKHWVDRARKIETEASSVGGNAAAAGARKENLVVVIMVHSAEKAKEVMSWPGVDAIVLQGTEAGGHGADFDSGADLGSLLDSVLALKSDPAATPLILAAGGISSPQAVSELLSREGIAAVVTGTALCVANESTLSEPQKNLLIDAKDGETSTARSLRWDVARGTTGWPAGVDGRGLRDQTSESTGEVQKGGPPVTWAGTGVGDVSTTAPAAEIVRHLMSKSS